MASSWKSSSGKENRARKRSITSIFPPYHDVMLRPVIVFHIGVETVDDYATKREPHRREHMARLQGLRSNTILIGGGPAPDGKSADLFYRLQQPWQVKPAMEEHPYWTCGVWTEDTARRF